MELVLNPMFDSFYQDDIDAVNAKFEAQKIAFAPLSFQAARALRDLGILELVSSSRKKGIAIRQIAEHFGINYGTLCVRLRKGMTIEEAVFFKKEYLGQKNDDRK